MSPDRNSVDATTPSEWHSIRPWTPRLSLFVREITSVSATFILSSTLSDADGEPEPSLASLGLTAESDDEEEDEEHNSDSPETKRRSIISDALAKGLSVNVNGAPWQRVLIRIDDKADEAVIIIYGLMPGRQYDIDLGLVQGGQNNSIRRQVMTEELPHADTQTDVEVSSFDRLVSSDPTSSTRSSSPNRTVPPTPPTTSVPPTQGFTPLTLEDRLNQLQHTLTLITSERDTLTVSLKSARRDAQKADAALRSEIEILKRASEKHTAAEHRARQKVLALQEAVKRAQTATREMEELVKEVEGGLPALKEKRAEKEQAYVKVKEDADQARKEREREGEKERKRVEMMKGELAGLGNKMEKLNGKKEKLEDGVMDLEEQLREIEKEIESVESDPYGYTFISSDPQEAGAGEVDHTGSGSGTGSGPGGEIVVDRQVYPSYLPIQRTRHQNTHPPGTIGRPSPAPIQRPSHTRPNSASSSSVHQQLRTQTLQNQRSSSLHPQSPVLHTTPQRRLSLKSATSQPQSQGLVPLQPSHAQANTSTSTSTSSSSTQATATTPASTLSSRAPPFEPGRSLRTSSSGYSGSPVLTHRSGPSRSVNPHPNLKW